MNSSTRTKGLLSQLLLQQLQTTNSLSKNAAAVAEMSLEIFQVDCSSSRNNLENQLYTAHVLTTVK